MQRRRPAAEDAAMDGLVALDHAGAAGVGHAALLHRRAPGARQREPGTFQPGAVQDPGQVGAPQAAERGPAAHGRDTTVRYVCALARSLALSLSLSLSLSLIEYL